MIVDFGTILLHFMIGKVLYIVIASTSSYDSQILAQPYPKSQPLIKKIVMPVILAQDRRRRLVKLEALSILSEC